MASLRILSGSLENQEIELTPDPMTVVYTLSAPRPSFAAGLTTQVGYVVGQAMLDQTAAGKTPTPIGTGPFIYSSWQPNDHFTATRNPISGLKRSLAH